MTRGILYSQVVQAAAKLLSEGKNPTVDSVRAALGETGSKSTIGPMLKRWKTENQVSVSDAMSGLPAELVEAVKAVQGRLQMAATAQIEQANEAHAAELAQLMSTLEATAADVKRLSGENGVIQQKLHATEADLARNSIELRNDSMALAAARSENAGLQRRIDDRNAEVELLAQQLNHTRKQFEHFQEATAQQRATDHQSYEHRITNLEQELASARSRNEKQQMVLTQREEQLVGQDLENTKLRAELSDRDRQLTVMRSERDHAAARIKEITTSREIESKRLDATTKAHLESTAAASAAAKEAELLSEQLVSTKQRLETVEQEKNQLIAKIAVVPPVDPAVDKPES